MIFASFFAQLPQAHPIFVHMTGIFGVQRGVSKRVAKQWNFFNFSDFSYQIRNLLVKSRGFFIGIFMVFAKKFYRCKKCDSTSEILGI